MKRAFAIGCALALSATPSWGAIIVNDSWADGGRNNGADALDTDWWTSTTSSAIEVSTGSLGLVSGTSGRGIHGTFPLQTLALGETVKATFTFTTPATVGSSLSAGLKAGLFDTTGKPGLAADLSASSGSPNALYNNLNGYMLDMDVNPAAADADLNIRERTNAASGQLMATNADFTSIGDSTNTGYTFAANTTYVGVFSVQRTATGLDLFASLSQGSTVLASFTASDASAATNSYGMLAFHANSNAFGSVATVNTPNNGLDFSNITIELLAAPVPEPTGLIACAAFGSLALRRRRAA